MTQEIITISPIDGSVVARLECATPDKIQAALSRAKQAQTAWKNTLLAERSALVSRAVDALVSKKDAIAEELEEGVEVEGFDAGDFEFEQGVLPGVHVDGVDAFRLQEGII